VFAAVPHENKEIHVIPEASHFDMYDLAPFVSEAFDSILPFFGKKSLIERFIIGERSGRQP